MSGRQINEWRVGDMAYMLEGDPVYPAGSVVPVGYVDGRGEPWACYGYCLDTYERKPLRVLQPGDVVPEGAVYRFIAGSLCGKEFNNPEDGAVGNISRNCIALVSLPDPESEPAESCEACKGRGEHVIQEENHPGIAFSCNACRGTGRTTAQPLDTREPEPAEDCCGEPSDCFNWCAWRDEYEAAADRSHEPSAAITQDAIEGYRVVYREEGSTRTVVIADEIGTFGSFVRLRIVAQDLSEPGEPTKYDFGCSERQTFIPEIDVLFIDSGWEDVVLEAYQAREDDNNDQQEQA